MNGVKYINLAEFAKLKEENLKGSTPTLDHKNTIIAFGDLSDELKESGRLQEFLSDEQELILSSLPIVDSKFQTESIRNLMKSSKWSFNYPTGLISSSLIKWQTIGWHLHGCPLCECTLEEIVDSVSSSGLRQIYTSDVLEFCDSGLEKITHPVMSEISLSLSILYNGINIAIDGEKIDTGNTGTNRVAVQLLSRLKESEFTRDFDILIPLGHNKNVVDVDSDIIQVGMLNSQIKNYDVLFRPCQSWEVNWLYGSWSHFETHVQWWLDFISFETPDYAGGLRGVSQNLNNAIWAFENFESTLFLSPSCMAKAVCIGHADSILHDVLACTIEAPSTLEKYPREKIILVVGNSFKHKSRVFAIAVLESLIKIDPEFRLVFIGGNPGFAVSNEVESELLAKNDFLRSRVMDLGKVDDKTLIEHYRRAMFLLAPSTVEGFGLVPFEAASYGVTPITSKIDTWKDYLELDQWIDLYSVDNTVDTLLKLFESEEKRNDQISKFNEWSRKNNWEYLANQCLLQFAQTIAISRQRKLRLTMKKRKLKSIVKRSRLFPYLRTIKKLFARA
jgi:glycosyltransferase involved in cell wall biosynthesis